MRPKEDVTLTASLRHTPFRTGLVAILPVALAFVQLLNGLLTDLPIVVGVIFATAMLVASFVFTRHHLAQLRLEVLESTVHTGRAAD